MNWKIALLLNWFFFIWNKDSRRELGDVRKMQFRAEVPEVSTDVEYATIYMIWSTERTAWPDTKLNCYTFIMRGDKSNQSELSMDSFSQLETIEKKSKAGAMSPQRAFVKKGCQVSLKKILMVNVDYSVIKPLQI